MIITLASASPRRKELIKKLTWVNARIVPSGADENVAESDPELLVKALALKKAEEVFNRTGGIVVGADTVVAVDDRILGKPGDADEVRSFFRLLCGRTHKVVTGIAVVDGNKKITDCETTLVEFGEYDETLVENYIAGGNPFDKAGGYGIQDEIIGPLVKSVTGDEDNVIGLPVGLLGKTLEENF